MSSTPIALGRPGAVSVSPFSGRVRALLERDALAIVVIAVWASVLAVSMPLLIVQDTFLAFVDGRLIAQHGLPHVDTLTYWTFGRPWTDQQWGSHLVLYEIARHGGLRTALVAGILCVVAALVVAAVASRKLGASMRSAAFGLLLPLVGASWLTQVRTQSLALVPFVVVYGLLAMDARRPGRRVLLVLPLLVVWANLHGSVVLAAGLTALYGLTLLRRPDARRRAPLLVVGAPLCVLASPYGLHLIGYYHTMLLSAPLGEFVQEWRPPSVGTGTAFFFISAFLMTALWSRHQRTLTSFERWAIVLLLVGAMTAVRNAVWFELAAAISFPRLLDAAWPSQIVLTPRLRRVNVLLASVAAVGAVLIVGAQFARPTAWLEHGRSPAAARAIAATAGPHGLVLADEEHADWLLWQEPSLAGRVAYDIRFELFDRRELTQIRSLLQGSRPVWQRCGVNARVVTFAHASERLHAVEQGLLAPGTRLLLNDPPFSVISQPSAAAPCRL
jgi:hypothetical protein